MNDRTKLLQFIDYGNQSITDSIKVIPDKLKNTPALAVRMVLYNKPSEIREGDDLSVTVKKQVIFKILVMSEFIIYYHFSLMMEHIWST